MGKGNAALSVDHKDAFMKRFGDGLQPLLALEQRLLRRFPLRNVGSDGNEAAVVGLKIPHK